MKHLLPILTAALALTAATASAAFNYDNLQDQGYTSKEYVDKAGNEVKVDNVWWIPNADSQVIHFDGYDVIRTRYNETEKSVANNQDTLYKIRITGESVDLYLTDWMDSYQSTKQVDALTSKSIVEYGYYSLKSDDYKIYTMDEEYFNDPDLFVEDAQKYTYTNPSNGQKGETMYRHGYYLGTFSSGEEIELYMKDSNGNSVKSFSTVDQGGAFGDGIDNYDQVVAANLVEQNREAYLNNDNAKVAAAKKAMPLAALDTNWENVAQGKGEAHRVFFGIYGMPGSGNSEGGEGGDEGGDEGGGGHGTSGHPLPGGLPIALVSGLFALGFWYVRRKKAIVG